jgi:hypothetical protein
MKRDVRAMKASAGKKALRRRKRERLRYVCCERCLRHVPGRFGRAEHFRPTAHAAALRDQSINS